MTPVIGDEVMTKVAKTLENTPFASSSLKQLSGGTANFIYRATLVTPLEDGTTEVLVKHGEDYIKDNPKFKLTLQRCVRKHLPSILALPHRTWRCARLTKRSATKKNV